MDRIAKLNDIEAALLEVRATLSKKYIPCECCGTKRYDHWDQKNARDFVNAAISRVQKVRDMEVRGVLDAEGGAAVRGEG